LTVFKHRNFWIKNNKNPPPRSRFERLSQIFTIEFWKGMVEREKRAKNQYLGLMEFVHHGEFDPGSG
jgi:hypothetical protein